MDGVSDRQLRMDRSMKFSCDHLVVGVRRHKEVARLFQVLDALVVSWRSWFRA